MQDHLSEFAPAIRKLAKTEADAISQAILLWNLIHHMILKYRKKRPNWIFARHSDLSRNPQAEFKALYTRLGLEFTPAIEQKISEFSSKPHTKGSDGRITRNSRDTIAAWKQKLSIDEISRIKLGTQDIAQAFYTEEDWA